MNVSITRIFDLICSSHSIVHENYKFNVLLIFIYCIYFTVMFLILKN